MSPVRLARQALAAANIPAPTDAQVTRCLALAGLALAAGDPAPYATAAAQLAADEAGKDDA